MLILSRPDIPPSEITPREVFEKRRQILRSLAIGAIAGGSLSDWAMRSTFAAQELSPRLPALSARKNPNYRLPDELTSYENATEYNNFYEFGTRKIDPSGYAYKMKTRPWTVSVEGLVAKPRVFDIDQLLKLAPMEERIYRLRCVEGWSMVIPWIGYPLEALIRQVEPLGSAKFVEFVTLADPTQMRGLDDPVLNWPYREGLRMDEARHPLTLLTFGMYGEILPNQNGAPVRITIPWKYGFKSAKSIVRIRFTDRMPLTSWNESAPQEYGFYSNVNPKKDHPRWSQATERRIGKGGEGFAGLFTPRIKTLMFNGYETQVGQLYTGMDLNRFY